MSDMFYASEIVKVALLIEQNGGTFYGLLADKMSNPSVKNLFLQLVEEERKHFQVFSELLSRANHWEPVGMYAVEYKSYMDYLASQNVFTEEKTCQEVTGKITTDQAALEYACGFEKDSILFYEGMKKYVPDNEIETIEKIINAEAKHLIRLVDMGKKLSSSH